MSNHILPNGDVVEYLDGPYREYTIYRIRDSRIDPDTEGPLGQPAIYKFTANPAIHDEIARVGELRRLDTWILDEKLDWHLKDVKYWREIYKRAELETFMPGLRVFEPKWDGSSQRERDEVSMYWKHLCWRGGLPIGEVDIWNPSESGYPSGHRYEYWGPRTAVRWILVLRFWIRREQHVLNAGTRRKLEDYPPHVHKGLSIAIKLMTKDLDFVDNIRFAETGKPGEMRRYKRAKDSGCCGSTDRYVIIGSKQYIIGCNFGH